MARRKLVQNYFEWVDGPAWRLRKAFLTLDAARNGARIAGSKFFMPLGDFEYEQDEILVVDASGAHIESGWVATYHGDILPRFCRHPKSRVYTWRGLAPTTPNGDVPCIACGDCGHTLKLLRRA